MTLDPALAPVRADPGQVEQVFLNLAVNARDAMPRGGRLEMRTRNVTLTAADAAPYPYPVVPGDYAEVTVTDDGVGIPPALLPQLFEPFVTTKEVGKGTGLGLSTVYGIVKQSGGYVWVESTPGAGTAFRVLLPRAAPAEDAKPAPAPEPAGGVTDGASATILLVEDEPPVRTLARRILQRQGYTILEAASAAEALALVERSAGTVDLILTDVVMPGGSGREMAERVRALRPSARTLFMSGYADDELARHGVLEPGVNLLEKPFSPDALVARVRQVLRDTA
jgi:two-component system cell cycle sensor histidine kinase/response regulator CckA